MKLIAIGDTHGKKDWKQITINENFDKIVFIGDYFDSFDIPASSQIENFKDIIAYKKANMDKVILLIGNHDFHYLKFVKETYSGYQRIYSFQIQELLESAISEELLQMCFVCQNMIFTHAGITKTWCKNNLVQIEFIEQSINELFKYKPLSFTFTIGNNLSPYGDDVEQSPIWVRPKSLLKDKIEGFIQIVGHTKQNNLTINNDIILIDTLDSTKEYLIWNNSKFSISKIT